MKNVHINFVSFLEYIIRNRTMILLWSKYPAKRVSERVHLI